MAPRTHPGAPRSEAEEGTRLLSKAPCGRAVWMDVTVFDAPGALRSAVATDISADGLFVEVDGPIPAHRDVQVAFTPPGWKASLTVKAQIVRVSPGIDGAGLALELVDLDPSVRDELDRTLSRIPVGSSRIGSCAGPRFVGWTEPID